MGHLGLAMLFLLNECVFDIGEPFAAFVTATRRSPGKASLGGAIRTGQAAAFEYGSVLHAPVDTLRGLCAEIAISSNANAALFVRPPNAKSQGEVAVRLADAPLTSLAYLLHQQSKSGPSAQLANTHVWRLGGPATNVA